MSTQPPRSATASPFESPASTSEAPSSEAPSPAGPPAKTALPPSLAARRLVRLGRTAALATLDAETGHPYASLVTVATAPSGAPLLLLSRLAVHTRNLAADQRASLLFDGTGATGDPLAGDRVTIVGRVGPPADRAIAARRFLARHPEAEGYAAFSDFAFYELSPEHAHFIGGFGRIHRIPAGDLETPLAGADELLSAEAGIVAHMNEDHADALALYAALALADDPAAAREAAARSWRMTGIDPAGLDVVFGDRSLRLDFPGPVATAEQARRALIDLVAAARARQASWN